MGYRSEVAFEIESTKEVILKELASLRLKYENPQALKEAFEKLEFVSFETGVVVLRFYVEGWKWYEEYEDVKALEAIWTHFEDAAENEPSIGGQFFRVGEEADDIEERSIGINFGYTNLYVPAPSICFDSKDEGVSFEKFKESVE